MIRHCPRSRIVSPSLLLHSLYMSYHIYYQKCIIELPDNTVIPVFLSGDNNVWSSDRKRSRSWSSYRFFNTDKAWRDTPDNIKANVRAYIEKYYLEQRRTRTSEDFPYNSFADFLNASAQYWFSSRIPWGDTVKSMLSWFSAPTVKATELFEYIRSVQLIDHATHDNKVATTLEELIDLIDKGYSIYEYEWSLESVLRMISRKKKQSAPPRPTTTTDTAYNIQYNGYAILSYRGGRFRYGYGNGKLFKTKAQAEKVLASISSRQTESVRKALEVTTLTGSFTF